MTVVGMPPVSLSKVLIISTPMVGAKVGTHL